MLILEDLRRLWRLELALGVYHHSGSGPCDKTREAQFNSCGPCDKTLEDPDYFHSARYTKENRYGMTIEIIQIFPDGNIFISDASVWKPPEKRSAFDCCPLL